MNLLQSSQVQEVYAGLTMLHELTKIYRWKSGDGRAGLEAVVTNMFPVALQIANRLVMDPSTASGTMVVLVLKSYKSAIAVRFLSYSAETSSDCPGRWSFHPNFKRTQS